MTNEPKPPVKPDDSGLCAEMSGFLFKHPCGMFAKYECEQCGKPICGQHSVLRGMENICVSCSTQQPGQQTDDSWRSADYWYGIDVDWDPNTTASPSWYRRKKRRQRLLDQENSFTDADEAIFEDNRGAGGDWEDDMGAS